MFWVVWVPQRGVQLFAVWIHILALTRHSEPPRIALEVDVVRHVTYTSSCGSTLNPEHDTNRESHYLRGGDLAR